MVRSLYLEFHYIGSCKSLLRLHWKFKWVRYIAKFILPVFVISRFDCTCDCAVEWGNMQYGTSLPDIIRQLCEPYLLMPAPNTRAVQHGAVGHCVFTCKCHVWHSMFDHSFHYFFKKPCRYSFCYCILASMFSYLVTVLQCCRASQSVPSYFRQQPLKTIR